MYVVQLPNSKKNRLNTMLNLLLLFSINIIFTYMNMIWIHALITYELNPNA